MIDEDTSDGLSQLLEPSVQLTQRVFHCAFLRWTEIKRTSFTNIGPWNTMKWFLYQMLSVHKGPDNPWHDFDFGQIRPAFIFKDILTFFWALNKPCECQRKLKVDFLLLHRLARRMWKGKTFKIIGLECEPSAVEPNHREGYQLNSFKCVNPKVIFLQFECANTKQASRTLISCTNCFQISSNSQ